MPHMPVLSKEVMEILDPKSGEFFIDGTFGSGGHSAEILNKISPKGFLLAVDWDKGNIERAKENSKFHTPAGGPDSRLILAHANYANLLEIIKDKKLGKADGLLIDLGFSSVQIEEPNRGFSFSKDEVLDMRYDVDSGNQTAAEIINSFNEKDLADIFYIYGEERFSRQIAKKIVEERRKEKILTTGRLSEIVGNAVTKSYEKGRINPATRVFQALRIYVNQELDNLKKVLESLEDILKPGGKAAILSFHSLEDRIVKNYFREMEKLGIGKILTKKPVIASREEIEKNPRSRSAKLRGIKII